MGIGGASGIALPRVLTMSNCLFTSSAFMGGPELSPRNAQQRACVSGGKTTHEAAHMPPQLTGSGPGLGIQRGRRFVSAGGA